MTNQTLVPRALFVANGVQTAFGFSFPVLESGDMEVWVDQTLQPADAYAVSGVGVPVGGTVIFTVPPPASSRVTLRRRMALNRTPEFPDTSVQAKPLNEEFGYHTAALQQLSDETALAVKRSFRSLSTADLTLPEPSAGRALRWNDAGDGLANSAVEVDAVLSLTSARAEEAAASAAAAAASRNSAASSAANAATAREVCDADVVVTGADRAAVAADRVEMAADRAGVAADRTAIQADRIAASAAATSAATARSAAQASEAAAIQAAADAATARAGAAADAANAQAAANAAAASQGSARASELSASGSASAAAASAAQAQAAAGVYTFATIAVAGQGTISADQAGDTLTLAAGANLAIATDSASDTVTLAVMGLANVATSGAYADLSGKPGLGSAAGLNVGTSSGQIPQLTSTGLPPLNASQLTALNAASLASGTVPAARLGSGTADATTYLRGDGQWAALPAASAYQFVQAVSFSGPQFDVINLASGYDYEFHFDDLVSGGNDGLYAYFGTNNTTFPTAASYYSQYVGGQSNPGASGPSWGWGANSGHSGALAGFFNAEPGVSAWTHFFVNDVGAARYKHYGSKGGYLAGNGFVYGMNAEGYWRNASAITAIRFFSQFGYAMSGTCLVYRRKRS